MDATIRARHGRTYRGEPLATLHGLPGDGADLTPQALRTLADALRSIADDCERLAARPAPRKGSLPPADRTYPLNVSGGKRGR